MSDDEEERAYQVAALRAVANMIQSGLLPPLRHETIEAMFLEAAALSEQEDEGEAPDG